jgi:dienelactone hydrolase
VSHRPRPTAWVPLALGLAALGASPHPAAGAGPAATRVRLASLDAGRTSLEAFLFTPASEGRSPGVVLMHGCGGMRRRDGTIASRERFWAEWLADRGHVALLLDSFGPRGIDELCTRRERPLSATRDRPLDAYGALAYLRSLPGVRGDRIALWGWSNGAMATLAAVAEQRPERGFRAAVAFYPGCGLERGFRDTGWSAQVPTLILVGLRDDWTPARRCFDLVAQAGGRGAPLRIRGFENAYHGFDQTSPLRQRLVDNPGWPAPRTVTVGGDPEARALAIEEVRGFLAAHLGP